LICVILHNFVCASQFTMQPQEVKGPNISPLKLIIVTLKTSLGSYLNLDMIAKKLPLDHEIIGKKLVGVVEEGAIKSRTRATTRERKQGKSRDRKDRKDRKDFSNQCTIIVHPKGFAKPLNLKVFGNGKIVVTGGTTIDDGRVAVELFRKKIRCLSGDYSVSPDQSIGDLFKDTTSYVKYMQKNYLVFLKLFSLFQINIDLKLDLILNKKIHVEKTFGSNNIIESSHNNRLFDGHITDMVRLVQIYNICHMYLPNDVLLKQLENLHSYEVDLVKKLYGGAGVTLPVSLNLDAFDSKLEISIENYNTMFSVGFQNDREKFTKILNEKYKTKNIISSAKFEPSNYQGINAKYISRVHCRSDCHSKTNCQCKEISFLIFQEGSVIITGGRSWTQMEDGYRVICDIVRQEYHNIYVAPHEVSKAEHLVPAFVESGHIFLNKKSQILENPRSYYLLKKMGLLEKYL